MTQNAHSCVSMLLITSSFFLFLSFLTPHRQAAPPHVLGPCRRLMENSDARPVRRVRCPRCHSVLEEPAGAPVYQCGGCGTSLRGTGRSLALLLRFVSIWMISDGVRRSSVLVQPRTAPARTQETRPAGARLPLQRARRCLLRADTWTPPVSPAPAGPAPPLLAAAGTEPPTRQPGRSPVVLPAPAAAAAALLLLQAAGAKVLARRADASQAISRPRGGMTVLVMLQAPAAAPLMPPQAAGKKRL